MIAHACTSSKSCRSSPELAALNQSFVYAAGCALVVATKTVAVDEFCFVDYAIYLFVFSRESEESGQCCAFCFQGVEIACNSAAGFFADPPAQVTHQPAKNCVF